MRRIYLSGVFACVSFVMFLSSCSNIEKIQGADKAETYYLRGEAYLKESSYEQALEKFNLVKNKFPYSKYAVDAELRIADTYYQKGDYIDAQKQYELFSEFHPADPRRDYAIYYSGMSYYELLPSGIDRDLSYGPKALAEFRALMELFPNSTYFKEALDKYTSVRMKLAEKEAYIGNFYRKKGEYDSAVGRFKGVLDNYSGLGFDDKMYKEIINCYIKQDKKEDAISYLDIYIAGYPDGTNIDWARKTREGLEK